MAEHKTKQTRVSFEAFLASVPDASKRADALALIEMMETASNEQPRMRGPRSGEAHTRRLPPRSRRGVIARAKSKLGAPPCPLMSSPRSM